MQPITIELPVFCRRNKQDNRAFDIPLVPSPAAVDLSPAKTSHSQIPLARPLKCDTLGECPIHIDSSALVQPIVQTNGIFALTSGELCG